VKIGDKIKELRELRGISQRQLAIKAELDPSYLSIVESGKRTNITLDVARRLSAALGVNLEELIESETSDKNEKMSIADKLREIRTSKGLTQEALGQLSGLGRTYVNHIECGRIPNITIQTAQKLAGALDVSTDDLMEVKTSDKAGLPDKSMADMLKAFTSDFADKLQKLEIIEIPVRGVIPAGNPAVEEEIDLGVIRVPREVVEGKIDRVFALKIGGESLSGDGLHYGDNVLIDPDAPIIDGKIYAVRIGGTEVLARHVYKENGHLRLESSNGEYKRLLATDVEIQGRLIYQMRKL
jgi:repressor LexA